MQSLLKALKSEQEFNTFMKLVQDHIYELATNENSYHIIIGLIIDFPESKRGFLNEFFIANVDVISKNKIGWHCMKKFISNNKDMTIRGKFINSLKLKFYDMLVDKIPASILLFALKNFGNKACSFIFEEVKTNVFYLINLNTTSLNFVEKIIRIMYAEDQRGFNAIAAVLLENQEEFASLVSMKQKLSLITTIFNNSNTSFQKSFMKKLSKVKIN